MLSGAGFRGRTRELGLLRGGYDRPEPSVGWVVGLPGIGKTETVLRAAADFRFRYHRVPPLSEPRQRQALAESLWGSGQEAGRGEGATTARVAMGQIGPGTAGSEGESPPSWEALFQRVVDQAPEERSTVLVVDDAHRWVESRARFGPALLKALERARARKRPVHVSLLAPEPAETPLHGEALLPSLGLGPLPFRAAEPFLPGSSVPERLRAYAVFGGIPQVLRLLDRAASLEGNLSALVLGQDAPLRDMPLSLLERYFQRPVRYAAILAALGGGEGDWGAVQAGVGDLTSSGQAGPYLKRLEEVGLVEVRRSLDASPGSRSRRYRITDPFVTFWFRFVLPFRQELVREQGEARCLASVRVGLDHHLAVVLPEVCRAFMAQDAMELMGANAREVGSLWGAGYDLPVAGVLATGVSFYGDVLMGGGWEGATPLAHLDAQIRETRFGFGRERRLRVLFLDQEMPQALAREAARRDDVALVALGKLSGQGGTGD